MRLAASNLSWPTGADDQAMQILRGRGFTGIEVAPTRIWPEWQGASGTAARAFAVRLASQGFCVPALQAILFGVKDAALFGDRIQQTRLHDSLMRAADLAAAMSAAVLVLGAPGARLRKQLAAADAFVAAAPLLSAAAQECLARGVELCIEPNPVVYGCDFVTTADEGAELVRRSPGLGLHLDAAGMMLAQDDPVGCVHRLKGSFSHFHASEPLLGAFSSPAVPHGLIGQALRTDGYGGWVSLEMREQPDPWAALDEALATVAAAYGDTQS